MDNGIKSYLDGLISNARQMHQSEDWAMAQIADALARRDAAANDIIAIGYAVHQRRQPLARHQQPVQQQDALEAEDRNQLEALREALLRQGD